MQLIPTHHVASGSYVVGSREAQVLEAYLGTCVGVTLADPVAGVGGLAHLLLPHPVCAGMPPNPEKYASTALPLFLRELYQAGASSQNLKAHIAGGALVGPLSAQDMDLDIGGRTAEIARNLLTAEGIAIETSETGGFFTCRMSFNMQTWETHIDPTGMEKSTDQPPEGAILPSGEEIGQAMETLQPIPQVALRLLRLMEEDAYNLEEIAREVQLDQVISARTLQLCNSAMFAPRKKIESLDHALVFLGQDLLIRLVVSAALDSYFSQTHLGYSLCKGGLFFHSVGTAVIAEKLAHFTGEAQPSMAYTAGLLHDIGKVVLDQYVTAAYPLFYRQIQAEENSLEVERQLFGQDHAQIGTQLARRWSFPDSLTEMIRHHHAPENNPLSRSLTHIVFLADLLMSRFNTGLESERMDIGSLRTRIGSLGLSGDQLPDLVDLIPEAVFADPCSPPGKAL